MTGVRKRVQKASEMIALNGVPGIQYLVQFRKNKKDIQLLINSDSEVNVITLAYTKQLGLWIQKTDVGTQKFSGSLLKTFGIVIAELQEVNKLNRVRFF